MKDSDKNNRGFVLDAEKPDLISHYLEERAWIGVGESVLDASIPGDGNMNYTLRIHTGVRTFILKQSRDYVEKYPHIPAPANRAMIEAKYYRLTEGNEEIRSCSPALLGMDEENNVIMLEDLGEASDYTHLYRRGQNLDIAEVEEISRYISLLHLHFNSTTMERSIVNREMRKLNAEHIFNYPYQPDNGFDLDTITPGLQDLSNLYKHDELLKEKIKFLSKWYVEDGDYLLHGDHYPGSWLKTASGVKVIDPEFAFFGPAEFDVSVMMAHYLMAQQAEETIQAAMQFYCKPCDFDEHLMRNLCGVEIMRRLIGLGQLPIDLDLNEKNLLLVLAKEMIMD